MTDARLRSPANPEDLIPTADQPLPTGDAKTVAVQAMFDVIAPRYDLVNRLMTGGLDVLWRRTAVDALALGPGRTVLDVASGTGDLCNELRSRDINPIAADLSFGMLAAATHPNARVQCDAAHQPIRSGSVDGVTCGFALRNFTDLAGVLAEMARVTRSRGRIALLEVSEPDNKLLRLGHRVHFGKIVPFIGGRLSNAPAYQYLQRSVAYLPETPKLLSMIEHAGFESVRRRQLHGGLTQLITATRR